MIRALVVADSGAAMRMITASLSQLPQVAIVAYASGRAPLAAVVEAAAPDVVVLDEMRHPARGLERIAEIRHLPPAVIGLTERADGPWVAGALHAGATAVVPRDVQPKLFASVLCEVLAHRDSTPRSGHLTLVGAA